MNAAARLLNQGGLSRSWVVTAFFQSSQLSLAALIAVVLVSALSVIYITNTTRSLTASVQQVLNEREQLHIQREQLLLEKSTWIMHARVQERAERRGMVVPDNKSVVVVKD